jgi:hypothetical protein
MLAFARAVMAQRNAFQQLKRYRSQNRCLLNTTKKPEQLGLPTLP